MAITRPTATAGAQAPIGANDLPEDNFWTTCMILSPPMGGWRRSVNERVEPVVERRAEQWPHLVAESPGVSGHLLGIKRFAVLPHGKEGHMAHRRFAGLGAAITPIAFGLPRGLRCLLDRRQG